jgi:hypothetical protein
MMPLCVAHGGAYSGIDLVTDLGQTVRAPLVSGGSGCCPGRAHGADDTFAVKAHIATSKYFVHDAPPVLPGRLLWEKEGARASAAGR